MQISNTQTQSFKISQKILKIAQDVIIAYQSLRQYKKPVNLIQAYHYVYEQCTEKPSKSQTMFNYYKQLLKQYLKMACEGQGKGHLIRQFNILWRGYRKFVQIISKKVFSYLDRYFLPGRQFGNLIQCSTKFFDKFCFSNPRKRNQYFDYLVNSLGQTRSKMIITNIQLYEFTKELPHINAQVYNQFKKIYQFQTQQFYRFKFNQIKTFKPISFYNSINNLWYFEEAIMKLLFCWKTQEANRISFQTATLFSKEIVQPYTDILLNHQQGFICALNNYNIRLLNLIIIIYSKFQGFQKIKKVYYDFIIQDSNVFLEKINKVKDDQQIILFLVQFFDKHNHLLTNGFNKHQQLYITLGNALQTTIGKWQKLPQVLFNYSKNIVTKGDFRNKIESIKLVFQKITNKDEFIHKCQQWVQKIILTSKLSTLYENQFINFIHQLCGAENTHKLINLFNDFRQSNAIQVKEIDHFSCKILSFQLWQKRFKDQIAVCLILPQKLENKWKQYYNSFISVSSKKKLLLLPLSSKLQLLLSSNKSKFLIKCSVLQASILYTLCESKKTIQEIIQAINIQKHILITFFQQLKFITSKEELYYIDWDSPQCKDIDLTLQIEQDHKFNMGIVQDRNILIEAYIVRFTKRKKLVTFQELYDYLCHSIKIFKPQPTMLKSALQKLIKRDYVEVNEQGLYIYKE